MKTGSAVLQSFRTLQQYFGAVEAQKQEAKSHSLAWEPKACADLRAACPMHHSADSGVIFFPTGSRKQVTRHVNLQQICLRPLRGGNIRYSSGVPAANVSAPCMGERSAGRFLHGTGRSRGAATPEAAVPSGGISATMASAGSNATVLSSCSLRAIKT